MKDENIKRIMAFAKSEKPMYKWVISVIDTIRDDDGTVRSERKPNTKIICIDELRNVYRVDELDERLVRKETQPNNANNTLFIGVGDNEFAEKLTDFIVRDKSKKTIA